MLQDLRYAARQLRKSPGFTLTAVATLALGIGANSAVFSVVNALLIRPIPVGRPHEIVRAYTSEWSAHGVSERRLGSSSHPDYLAFRDGATRTLAGLVAYGPAAAAVAGPGGGSATLQGLIVSGNYFDVLGLSPSLGRFFAPDEDAAPMARPAVVLSHAYWRSRYGGDPSVLGRTLVMNGTPFTVIGVGPEGFAGADVERTGDFFVPMATQRAMYPAEDMLGHRGVRWLDLMGRLRPGATPEAAEAELGAVMRALAERYPAFNGDRAVTVRASSTMTGADERGGALSVSAGLLLVTSIVLVIASLNVAGLLLVRAVRRRREIAIRLALGAGRARVVRQLLTESLLLAVLAAGPAVLLALWATDLARTLDLPVRLDLSPDWRVVAFTLLVAAGTGAACGLAPALRASAGAVLPALTDGGGATGARGGARLRDAMVVGQLALSLLLLAVGGLLLRSLGEQRRADPGFAVDRVLLAPLRLDFYGYAGPALDAVRARLLASVRAVPGVEAATFGGTVPLGGGRMRTQASIPGYAPAPREDMEIFAVEASTDYARTLGMPMVRGRELRAADASAGPAALVNESMARRYWAGRDPVGAPIRMGGRAMVVTGVVRDTRFYAVSEPPVPMVFMQRPLAGYALLVRAAPGASPASLLPAVRRALLAVEPRLALDPLHPLADELRESLLPARVGAAVVGGFGALALALAALGLYGVMSYGVAQRTREIGVRMALGAGRGSVVRLVVGRALRLVLVGGLVGAALAVGAARLMRGVLYGVGAFDPATFALVSLALGVTALAASALPARRAVGVDPASALRGE